MLILGYLVYGAIVEKIFGTDKDRKTPCYTCADGVDYIPMKTWKVYLIQFLNIAGTGPIFGAIQGILFGPAAYLWIVFGCIFGGAVHDFLSGMISMRENGASLPELVGKELGDRVRFVMRLFSLGLMIMVGAVFVTTPAGLLSSMTANWGFFGTPLFWSILIFSYYILATLLPIDALIGRIYPIFGIALLIMAAGVFGEKYILADGNLDRTALREQVFSDMKNKESLERIVHPIIRREIMKALLQSEKDHQLLVLPLLIEGGYQCWCDELWLLRVDKKCQVDRLISRDGITRKLAEEMIASQMPFDKKRRFADRIIDNRGSREKTFYQAEKSFFRFLKKFY